MNQENIMSTRNIPEGTEFFIPHYQRGYRWGEKEVSLLLDDLSEFVESGTGDTYCLQPLVFKLDGNQYWVVDGQQRLTTIWLLFQALGICPQWKIRYGYLEGQPCIEVPKAEDANSKDINKAFRWEAYHTMQTWLKGHGERTINNLCSLLKGTTDKQIVFIKYFVQDGENEHHVFDRLNNRKIPLTSAELIRALFMSSSLSANNKMEIAKEWKLIEDSLRIPEMWDVFASLRVKKAFPVRLDLLFQATSDVGEEEIKRDDLAVFHDLELNCNKEKTEDQKRDFLNKRWAMILKCFWWMKDCQSNPIVYNYLGWLTLYTSNSLKTIYSWWKECGCKGKKFECKLRQEIASLLQTDGVLPDFSEWRFDAQKKLKEFLLLLNILECNSQEPPIRFRFDAFLREKGWDIEHIHSQSYKPLSDLSEEKKREILNLAQDALSREQANKLGENESFNEKVDYLNSTFEAKEPDFDKNAPENLVLLDLSTNRAYKNAWFPVKRSWIVQEARKGRFVPPCTITAFMKFFDPSPKTLIEWGKSDAKAYGDAMRKLYEEFKSQCESEEQS